MAIQNTSLSLPPVLRVDSEKCVNCHACIAACPVKHCNDGSGNHVAVNPDLCLGCGQCIRACHHEARLPIDDSDLFFSDRRTGVRMVAIVAPAVAAVFPDKWLRLNGWLKHLGVEAIFDVSFGAELTVKTYLDHLAQEQPRAIIAQPCPALVTYIETYRPELIPYLAPCDSPMLHTAKMIRRFYPQWSSHRLVVCSPCAAKRREFSETGIGDYNLTFNAILKHLESARQRIDQFPEVEYDNPPAERAVLFSTPGGLLETARRWNPEVHTVARKVEGPHTVYHYLDHLPEAIQQGENPLLIDCLNCELGCNGGPGTPNAGKSQDRLESAVSRRSKAMQHHHAGNLQDPHQVHQQITQLLEAYWEPGLYRRTYVDRRRNVHIRRPDALQRAAIYRDMVKRTPEDELDCGGCGYGTCEEMAVAIHNGLNRPGNCHLFRQREVEHTASEAERLLASTDLDSDLQKLQVAICEIETATKEALGLAESTAKATRNATATLERLAETSSSIAQFTGAIREIAQQTRLLALNARIESAHVGAAGVRFGVVASEIKELAYSSGNAATQISQQVAAVRTCSNDLEQVMRSLHQLSETLRSTQTSIARSVSREADATRQVSDRMLKVVKEVTTQVQTLAEATRRKQ